MSIDAANIGDFLLKLCQTCVRQGIGEAVFLTNAPLLLRRQGKEMENRNIQVTQEAFNALVIEFSKLQGMQPAEAWSVKEGAKQLWRWPQANGFPITLPVKFEQYRGQRSIILGMEPLDEEFSLMGGSQQQAAAPPPPPPPQEIKPVQQEPAKPSAPRKPVPVLTMPGGLTVAHGGHIPSISDDALARWFDDFCQDVCTMEKPKPKDLIFSPNKANPYVTVPEGLLPISNVTLGGEEQTTVRLAKLILLHARNPEAMAAFERVGIARFECDVAYRTTQNRRFRVNIADIFDVNGEHGFQITMRLLPERPFTVDALGLPSVITETISNLRMGLVLICGTTGSGKSTTMAAILDYLLKTKSINLLTIENPIETMFPPDQYPHSLIMQREVGMHTIDAQKAMQSAVRQTLNVAMVGEIRNSEDMGLAFDLALSGHLIFATLHSGTVGESITRIVEMFPVHQEKKVRETLSTQYKIGMAQILVPGLKKSPELVIEIMRLNRDVQDLILQRQSEDRNYSMREIIEMYTAVQETRTLDQSLVELLKEGRITEDTAMFNSPDAQALVYRQNKLGVKFSQKWDPTGALLEDALSNKLQLIKRDKK